MEAYFKLIRSELLKNLKESNLRIRVAMAWFTNLELFQELINCLDRGVVVELLIINDFINNGDWGLNFQEFIDRKGKLYYGEAENPMHNKFCIIDEELLITGSYNWTYYAENRNCENIIVITDHKIVSKYIEEFERLIQDKSKVEIHINLLESEIIDLELSAAKNYLAYDFFEQYNDFSSLEKLEQAINFMPSKDQFKATKDVYLLNNSTDEQNKTPILKVKPRVRTLTSSLGIKATLDNVQDQFAVVLEKGNVIPITKSRLFTTAFDNQTTIAVEIYSGVNNSVSSNLKIGKILVKDLPSRPKKESTITVTFTLTENFDLSILVRNNSNGSEMEAFYNDITF